MENWKGFLRLWTWDPAASEGQGATIKLVEWVVPNSWITAGCVGVQVLINEDRIWVAPVNSTTWQLIEGYAAYDSSTDTTNGHLGRADSGNRGRAVFFGRGHDGNAVVATDPEEAHICYWEQKPGMGDTPEPAPPTPTGAEIAAAEE